MTRPYIPTASNLFFTKNDPQDIRLGDLAKPLNSTQSSFKKNVFSICGYPDDEGIQLNGGRIGAANAPASIRQFLYKMTPPTLKTDNLTIYDIGDLPSSDTLEGRHAFAEQTIYELQQQGSRTVSFGGGHDYGFSDASGFLKAHLDKDIRPIVLNFDAHLDVRSTDKGQNSGTPFYRLLSAYEGQFDFFEIGIQPQCNSIHHLDWAKSKGAQIFDIVNIQNNGLNSLLQTPSFQKLHRKAPLFISFDIDALTSSEAPGCSQSWPTGIKLNDYLSFFNELKKNFDLRGLGIYEVSPPLDFDNYTSKAAALIAYHFLMQDIL